MKICRWDESGLEVSDIVLLMTVAGDELPDPLSERVDVTEYTIKLMKKGSLYLVLGDNGAPVGVMGFYANDQETKTAYLSIASLLPKVRRMGIGSKLMKIFISECKNAGMKKVCLEVNRENSDAVAYYEKMGFSVTSPGTLKIGMTANL